MLKNDHRHIKVFKSLKGFSDSADGHSISNTEAGVRHPVLPFLFQIYVPYADIPTTIPDANGTSQISHTAALNL